MNRQQRRAANKRGITGRDLKQERFDSILFAVRYYSVAVAMVLRDKLGFGPIRLNRVMSQIQEMFDSIQRGLCDNRRHGNDLACGVRYSI